MNGFNPINGLIAYKIPKLSRESQDSRCIPVDFWYTVKSPGDIMEKRYVIGLDFGTKSGRMTLMRGFDFPPHIVHYENTRGLYG
jgi:hypothetical protein